MKYYNKLIIEKDKCTVLLYGDIGDTTGTVSSDEIVSDLLEASKEGKPINVRINSNGGEVYAGIAIFNALRNCNGEVNIYIDGVAASISSVIALCGKPVWMNRYARLMIHRISGTCSGTADDLQSCVEEMESLEDMLCQIYTTRCKLSPENIRKSYFDGKEHWLTAQQALDTGLIDGIYDDIPEDKDGYENHFASEDGDGFSAFKTELCTMLGISPDSPEKSVYRAVKRLTKGNEANAVREKIDNASKRGWIEDGQRNMYMALAKSNRQAFLEFMGEKSQKEMLQIESLLNRAVSMGKVLPMERTVYKNIGSTMGIKILAELIGIRPGMLRAARCINLDREDRKKWTLDDWRTYAPGELASNPRLYEELRRKEGGGVSMMSLEWYRRNDPDFLKDNPDIYRQLIEKEYKKNNIIK